MRPALSVILLTTLIGAGQGLFFALYGVEMGAQFDLIAPAPPRFFVAGCALSIVLLCGGLAASFFHLGHPERAWRAMAMWRTSWLSREVIVLPAFIVAVATYGAAHRFGYGQTMLLGAAAAALCVALFVCTAMIYACLKFLQEWHTPLTLINFFVLGTASGLMLAAALAAYSAAPLAGPLAIAAAVTTVVASLTRGASLVRNARIRPKSSLRTAIGISHSHIMQKSQGQMGGSFNTREFFHGKTAYFLHAVKWVFLLFAFLLPVLLTVIALRWGLPGFMLLAFAVQFLGLLAERWYFFAQARHPQNIYYQVIS